MDKNFLFEIINKLKKKGCDQSDVFFSENFSLSSSRRLDKLEKNEHSENSEIGIRAILGKKQSIISSNNTNPKNIETLVDKIFEMVSVVPENQYCGLPDEKYISQFNKAEFEDLDLYQNLILLFWKFKAICPALNIALIAIFSNELIKLESISFIKYQQL